MPKGGVLEMRDNGEVLIAEPGTEELLGGVVLEPVHKFGILEVYRRKNYRQWKLPRYVVVNGTTGRHLEDFRSMRDAFGWARKNKEG